MYINISHISCSQLYTYYISQLYFSDGKFVEAGNQFWFPDDVTLGYIIGDSI